MNTKTLEQLRKKIDAVDKAILTALSKRKKLEEKIGAYKREQGMKLLDPVRRNSMLKVRVAQGVTRGIQPQLVRKLFTLIHHYSLSTQKKGKA